MSKLKKALAVALSGLLTVGSVGTAVFAAGTQEVKTWKLIFDTGADDYPVSETEGATLGNAHYNYKVKLFKWDVEKLERAEKYKATEVLLKAEQQYATHKVDGENEEWTEDDVLNGLDTGKEDEDGDPIYDGNGKTAFDESVLDAYKAIGYTAAESLKNLNDLGPESKEFKKALALKWPATGIDTDNEVLSAEKFEKDSALNQQTKFDAVVDSVVNAAFNDVKKADAKFAPSKYFKSDAWAFAVSWAKIELYIEKVKKLTQEDQTANLDGDDLIPEERDEQLDPKTGKTLTKSRKLELDKLLDEISALIRARLTGENSVAGDGWSEPTDDGKIGKVTFNYVPSTTTRVNGTEEYKYNGVSFNAWGDEGVTNKEDGSGDGTVGGYRWADAKTKVQALEKEIYNKLVGAKFLRVGTDSPSIDNPYKDNIKVGSKYTEFKKTFWNYIVVWVFFGWAWATKH